MKDKETFEGLIKKGYSTSDISKEIGVSQTNVRYWLKKFGLKTESLKLLTYKYKFSDLEILKVWEESDSVNQFLKNLGVNTTGGSWYHYKKRLLSLGVDLSDSSKNGRSRGGRKTAQIKNTESVKQLKRLPRNTLKKSMDLAGIPYECSECLITEWRGVKIKLHIHHFDHDKTNNLNTNLTYLCPNCHGIKHHEESS